MINKIYVEEEELIKAISRTRGRGGGKEEVEKSDHI